MYTCTCLDSVTHTTVCKYIHSIQILGDRLNNTSDTTQSLVVANTGCRTHLPYLLKTMQHLNYNYEIQAQISQCDNMDTLKSVIHHPNCAIGTINAMTKHPV